MSELNIQTCAIGLAGTNCYVVYHERTKEAVLIDPADNHAHLAGICRKLEIKPKVILLTHGHFDHILAAEDLRRDLGCPIYAHEKEDALLRDPSLNLSGSYGTPRTMLTADRFVTDQEELDLIGFTWRVIWTPGHTLGSVCYYIPSENVLFSGDTLFLASIGRTDMPTGSSSQLIRSVADKLLVLPEETKVYPGHDAATTISYEKRFNPVAGY